MGAWSRRGIAVCVALSAVQASCGPGRAPAAPPATVSVPPMPPAPAAPPPSFDASTQASFTESIARLVHEASAAFRVAVLGPLTIHVDATDTDKHDLRVSLDRVWAECQGDPRHCEDDARSFVDKMVAAIETPAAQATREQVVAVLRPRAYFDAIGGPSASGVVADPFVGDLFAAYVVDLPQAVRSLSAADMTSLGLARGDLPSLARANLAHRLGSSVELLARAKPGSVAVVQTGSYFESSRLLLVDDWVALAARLTQPMFAAVPANDVLVFAVAPPAEQLAKLRGAIQGLYASSERPVSPHLYRWDAGRWIVAP